MLRAFIVNNINVIYAENGFRTYLDWADLKSNYSSITDDFHRVISPKSTRLFNSEQLASIYEMPFFSSLKSLIGQFSVTQEENYGLPEIYWRITRTNKNTDIGPIHADGWFWDLNPSWQPDHYTNRTKVWVPLEVHLGRNGLNVVPGSHNKSYQYQVIEYDGKRKPSILSIIDPNDISLLDMETSDIVIFHDRLLHGGALNTSCYPRVSFEFTCSKING